MYINIFELTSNMNIVGSVFINRFLKKYVFPPLYISQYTDMIELSGFLKFNISYTVANASGTLIWQ
jgi:hypothetical protein